MCSSPFDCALFENGLLKLEDSKREKKKGWWWWMGEGIYLFVIQAKENVYSASLKSF